MFDSRDNTSDQSSNQKESDFERKFRFGLPHLFYLVALIAAGLVVMGPASLLVTGNILFFWFYVGQYLKNSNRDWLVRAGIAVVVLLLISVLIPPIPATSRDGSRWMHCLNNMRQIVLALRNYESANSSFPPAATFDADGKPMHSWRVAILPFVEEQNLYDQYDFSEPWDSTNNSKLGNQAPYCYFCFSSG